MFPHCHLCFMHLLLRRLRGLRTSCSCELQDVLDRVPPNDVLLVLGDLNE